MKLPQNKRRDIANAPSEGIKVWLYADPFVGKTTFADQWPNAINLNTDGNIKYVSTPYLTISEDALKGESAWSAFVETVDQLTRTDHEFETIIVDLIDDMYQFARVHHVEEQGWVHESEPGFGRGYDTIRQDFYAQIRRLTSSGLNIILLSHTNEKTLKSRTGRETTIFMPNLPDKVANKIAGMVDVVARAYIDVQESAEGALTESRKMQLTATADEFSGGRLQGLDTTPIDLDYSTFMKTIEDALGKPVEVKEEAPKKKAPAKKAAPKKKAVKKEEPVKEEPKAEEVKEEEAEPVKKPATKKKARPKRQRLT